MDKTKDSESVIEGRNPVMEALNAGRTLDKVYIARGDTDKTLARLASRARAAGAVVIETDRRALDSMSLTGSHQGVIAHAALAKYVAVSKILHNALEKDEKPFIIACDGISDTQNLGAIIRTAECAGAHGILIPKRRSAGLSAGVGKSSAGAVWHMDVARVSNLPSALNDLKKEGLWIYGAAPGNEDSKTVQLWDADLSDACCLVIGSEGDGISRLVRDRCDYLVNIPMLGEMTSLNASAAAAILMYETVRKRNQF